MINYAIGIHHCLRQYLSVGSTPAIFARIYPAVVKIVANQIQQVNTLLLVIRFRDRLHV